MNQKPEDTEETDVLYVRRYITYREIAAECGIEQRRGVRLTGVLLYHRRVVSKYVR